MSYVDYFHAAFCLFCSLKANIDMEKIGVNIMLNVSFCILSHMSKWKQKLFL